MRHVIDALRCVAARTGAQPLDDAELLDRFIHRGDEAAFAALVYRHGPMVLGVCRRILHHAQDAEDAFQATFLVLVRKAATIAPRGRVGNWLYGVARQTARKALSLASRRRAHEQTGTTPPEPAVTPPVPTTDLADLLAQELDRLPEPYRAAVVLCDVQGHSGREAARLLGWPEGTLFTRLSRGRKLLADRLGQRGLDALPTLAGPALAPGLITTTTQAAVATAAGPATAAAVVSAPVAALTEGVLQAMISTQLKCAAALVLVVGLVGFGVGAGPGFGPGTGGGPTRAVAFVEEPARADLDALLAARWRDEADEETFLRRAFLDLTGQVPPPSVLQDLSRFLREPSDPAARAAQLDLATAKTAFDQAVLAQLRLKNQAEPPPAELAQARARLAEAQAILEKAQKELDRRLAQEAEQQRLLLQRWLRAKDAQEQALQEARKAQARQEEALVKARQDLKAAAEALARQSDERAIAEMVRLIRRQMSVREAVDAAVTALAKAKDADKQAQVQAIDAVIAELQARKAELLKDAPKKP